jgi:hypothetical protein
MTTQTRRTEIQIETHEVKVIRLRRRPALALCRHCGEIVTALTPVQTAEVLEMTEDEVLLLLEDGRFHLVNSERGFALICGNSFGDENEIVTRKSLSTNFK